VTEEELQKSLGDRRIEIIMDDGVNSRGVFVAAGDSVQYERNTHVVQHPPYFSADLRKCGRRRPRLFTRSLETTTYE